MASEGQVVIHDPVPAALRPRQAEGNYLFSTMLVIGIALVFLLASDAVEHWFLLPVMLCGVLSGVDVVRWARSRLDSFDPQAIIGFVSFYGLFVAPLLHVLWGRFGAGYDLILREDWRPWLGWMALLQAAGLVLYRLALRHAYWRTSRSNSYWQLDATKTLPVFGAGTAVSLSGLLFLYWKMGGISGIIGAYESNIEEFVGKGWLLIFAWPLVVIALMTVLTTRAKDGVKTLPYSATLLLAVAGFGHFMLLGWHGSRSATVWALFWMAGIVHYRYRRLSVRFLTCGLFLLVSFMYFYGFYKERGIEGVEVLRDPKSWIDPRGYRRDMKGMFLGDFARADSSAFILRNLIVAPQGYDYRWGLTYAGALTILIPRNFWPDRPRFKVEAGTEAQLGKHSPWESARVYGLAGEAMLNFGPVGVLPAFALYGALLGWYRKKFLYWDRRDSRLLLAPFFTLLFLIAFIGDSDVLLFGAITEGTLPVACVLLASRRKPRAAELVSK